MTPNASLSRRGFLTKSVAATATIAIAPAVPATGSSEVKAQSPNRMPATSSQPLVTRIIADWVVASKPGDIPANVRKESVRSIVNVLGAAIGGSADPTVTAALRTLTPYSGPPRASILGRRERLDPLNAALVNAISSHVLDFDDTELNTIIHPSGVVAFALLGLAADHPISGADFLHAFVLGTEVECRLGNAIYPSHYQLGWHITATCGIFGAAAACGKILGLSSQQMVWALGNAAVQSSGLKVVFGSMGKAFQVGRAAGNGLLSALLAAQDFTSSDVPLEGVDGYFAAASRAHDDAQLTTELGQHYEISWNTYKPFPCGIVIHPAIDAAIQLYKANHLPPDVVESVAIRGNPLILQLTGKKTPHSGLEGKFSVYHSVAIALIRGRVSLAEYTDDAVIDPQVVALRSRVEVTTDSAVASDEIFMTLKTKDGRTLEKHVEHAVGSLERPMSNSDLEDKFLNLAIGILPQAQATKLLAMCWNLEQLPDISTLVSAGASR